MHCQSIRKLSTNLSVFLLCFPLGLETFASIDSWFESMIRGSQRRQRPQSSLLTTFHLCPGLQSGLRPRPSNKGVANQPKPVVLANTNSHGSSWFGNPFFSHLSSFGFSSSASGGFFHQSSTHPLGLVANISCGFPLQISASRVRRVFASLRGGSSNQQILGSFSAYSPG